MRSSTLFLSAALSFSAGCYYAEFDPDRSGTFVCGSTDECPEGQLCYGGVCVSDDGPALEISGPEPFTQISVDNLEQLSAFTITVRGSGLNLTDGVSVEEGSGHIRITIDDSDQFGTIVAGNLTQGFNSTPIDISGLPVGPHRIRARAFYGDGTPYSNPSAIADAIFFVDDGSPQIAIVEPRPGHQQRISSPMPIAIAAINWTWNSANSPLAENEGHTHVYSLPNYPQCLQVDPTSSEYCNNFYLQSFSGQGDATNPILLRGEVATDNLMPLGGGTHPFQAGLQTNEHDPFPMASANEFDQVMFQLLED